VDYSLFIMVMMVETLEKVEIPTAEAPVEFLPSIFAISGSVSVFLRRSPRGSLWKSSI
jgi:hypothetical protein